MARPRIEVTADLITQAIRGDSSHCMIADAIKAAMPYASDVTVDLQTIRYSNRKRGERYVFLTPARCQQQLIRFDQGTQVLPWAFSFHGRPTQTIPITVNQGKPNKTQRPHTPGPKRIITPAGNKPTATTVRGGQAPPTAVLSNAKGQRRIFGVRAATTFDPSQPG